MLVTQQVIYVCGVSPDSKKTNNYSVEFGAQPTLVCLVVDDSRKCIRYVWRAWGLIFGCSFCNVVCPYRLCARDYGGYECDVTCA